MSREVVMVLIGMSIPFLIQGLTGFSIGAFFGRKVENYLDRRKQ